MEHILLTWLDAVRGRRFLLFIAGRLSGIHGWKREHVPIDFQVIDSTLIIHFDGSECLTISDVTGLTLHPDGQLVVQDASQVRFSWCSDRDPAKECEEIFRKAGKIISFIRMDDSYTTSTVLTIFDHNFVVLR
jgi:hypothetical protein